MNGTVMALYKHFGYAGRAAEIAVYLKRRMGIEQIRIGSPVLSAFIGGGVELFGNQFIGVITVEQPCP